MTIIVRIILILPVVALFSSAYPPVVRSAAAVVSEVSLVVRIIIGLPPLVYVTDDVLPIFPDKIQFALNSLIILNE